VLEKVSPSSNVGDDKFLSVLNIDLRATVH